MLFIKLILLIKIHKFETKQKENENSLFSITNHLISINLLLKIYQINHILLLYILVLAKNSHRIIQNFVYHRDEQYLVELVAGKKKNFPIYFSFKK